MGGRDDIDTIRAHLADPQDVARRLGLDRGKLVRQGGRGISVCCPAHGDRTPSLSLTRGPDGTLRVRCFGCELQGDVFSLIAAIEGRTLPRDFRDVLEQAAALAGVTLNDSRRGGPVVPMPRWRPPPPEPPKYPPAKEVIALVNACVPCRSDAEVSAWLRKRKLDPELVDLYGLAFALPVGARHPTWARYKGEREKPVTWAEDGYRLVIPMRDAAGRLASVRVRAVVQMPDTMPKALPASGFDAVGLAMADHGAALMLSSGRWLPGAERQVLIAEGEPDWVTAATHWNADDMFRLAVLGIGGKGQWTKEIANRIPDGSTVEIWTDQDDAGDAYAVEIVSTLRGRCTVLESYPAARAERRRTFPERKRAKEEAERAARSAQRRSIA